MRDNLASIASDDPGSTARAPIPEAHIGSMALISLSPIVVIVAALIRFGAAVSSTLLAKVLICRTLRMPAGPNCGEVL